MQIEVTTVLGFLGSAVGTAVSIYMAILRYAIGQEKAAIERRFISLEKEVNTQSIRCTLDMKKLEDRMNDDEKTTIRLTGSLNLIENNHTALNNDIEEIKQSMITKAEFEPRMTNLERTLNQILSELRGRYPSHSGMPAVSPPKR